MKVDLLLLQLAIVFLPGIIWARLDSSYAAKVKPSDGQFLLRAFLFGITTYAVEFLAFALLDRPFTIADFTDTAARAIVTRDVL